MLTIRPTEADDASQVTACIDSVARERRFVGNMTTLSCLAFGARPGPVKGSDKEIEIDIYRRSSSHFPGIL